MEWFLDEGELQGPLPVAAKNAAGQRNNWFLVSDPGILINSMLVKDDNLLFIKTLTGSDIIAEKFGGYLASHQGSDGNN